MSEQSASFNVLAHSPWLLNGAGVKIPGKSPDVVSPQCGEVTLHQQVTYSPAWSGIVPYKDMLACSPARQGLSRARE